MPATPSLLIADLQNGQGATATIVGADAGTTNTIYTSSVALLQLGIAPPVWISQGSIAGNGTLQLPVAPGYYWAYCASALGGATALTPPLYFAANRSNTAILTQIRNAVQAKIQGLVLNGLPSSRIYVKRFPVEDVLQMPCVVITDEGEQEGVKASTNATDDVEYPIRVFIADRSDPRDDTLQPVYERWREQIMRGFRSQRLPGVLSVFNCTIQPRLIFDPHLPQYQYMVSGMTLRFLSRELHAG